MASQTIKINSRADLSGINSAKQALGQMGDAAKHVSGAIKTIVAAKVMQGISELAAGSMKAFNEATISASRLNQAVKNNATLTAGAFDRLSKSAANFQKVSAFDGDDIKSGQAYIASLGLTEDQINKTTKAAMDLAAAGVMPLDKAFESLGKTYTGTAGTLGKLNGNVKSLTKEQLKNGDAVKLVAEQYKGYAAAMANTPTGKTERLKVAFGDIKETLGQIPAGIQELSFDKLLSGLEDFNKKLNDGINFFFIFLENLPEAGAIAFDAIGKCFKKIFSWEFIGGALTICCNFIIRQISAVFAGLAAGWTALVDMVKGNKDLKMKIEVAEKRVLTTGQNLVEARRNAGAWTPKTDAAWQAKVRPYEEENNKAYAELKALKEQEGKSVADIVGAAITTGFEKTLENVNETAKETVDYFKQQFSPIVDEAGKEISGLAKDGKSKTLTQINRSSSTSPAGAEEDETEVTGFFDKLKKGLGGLDGILGNFAQVGTALQNIISGNPLGIIVQAISGFMSMFTSIENVGKSLNFVSTIFERVSEIIAPIVNLLFAPLVDIFTQLGEIIGVALVPIFSVLIQLLKPFFNVLSVILQAITPIVNVVAILAGLILKLFPLMFILNTAFSVLATGIAFIFNTIIRPIVNFALLIITGVGNFVIGIYNTVVNVLKSINIFGWRPFGGMSTMDSLNYNEMKLEEINTSSTETATTSSTSATSSANYSAAKDVYINIYYQHSFVNGDAEQIAIQIKKEIEKAEKKGY